MRGESYSVTDIRQAGKLGTIICQIVLFGWIIISIRLKVNFGYYDYCKEISISDLACGSARAEICSYAG